MSAASRELLTAYALDLLGPEERVAVERALASDPALAAEHAAVVRHLALYERFPEPPAPPPAFERVAALAFPVSARARRWTWAAAAAALVLLLAKGALWYSRSADDDRGPPPVPYVAGEGLNAGGSRGVPLLSTSARPAELWLGQGQVVLDAHSLVRLDGEGLVELLAGRAYFDISDGPFRVRTREGDVEVLGTHFEVDLRSGLVVGVAKGRVRVGVREVGPGERLAGGVVSPATEVAGTFFRRPLLRLEGPGSARPGEVVQIRLVLENPTHVAQTVRGPETVATGALLTLTDPTGAETSRGLDFARALSGGLQALSPVTLGPLERRLTVFELEVPAAPTGSWRLAALYRPQGEAPIASAPFTLEVR